MFQAPPQFPSLQRGNMQENDQRPIMQEPMMEALHEAEESDDDDDDDNMIVGENQVLPETMLQDDPHRMKLTRQEHRWAMEIKESIDALADLDNLTDFMYAQLAIICQDNVTDAVRRAYGLQHFKEAYGIEDGLQQGRRCMQSYTNLFPTQLLSFSFSQNDGTYVLVHDASKLDTVGLAKRGESDLWFIQSFYIHTALSPDLESIRKGCICCVECEGVDWTKKQDIKLMHLMFSQLLTNYPFRGQCKHYHTGMIANMAISTLRKILPPHMRYTFQTGLQFDGRLDQAFLVPTVEIANQRLLGRIVETLRRRYDNEITFSLAGHD